MKAIATDWEEGRPPQMLEIDAFILGHVRRGWRRGSIFIPLDCTHPAQNMAIDIDLVTHWRARDSVVVIEQPQSSYYGAYQPYGMGSYLDGIFGSMFGF